MSSSSSRRARLTRTRRLHLGHGRILSAHGRQGHGSICTDYLIFISSVAWVGSFPPSADAPRRGARSRRCQFSSSPPWPVASPGRTCSHGRSSEASPLATQSCSPLGSRLALADGWPADRWPATRWLGGTSRLCRSSRQGSHSMGPRSSRAATAASSYVPQRVMSAAADGRGLEHAQHAAATRPVDLTCRRLAASQVMATAR